MNDHSDLGRMQQYWPEMHERAANERRILVARRIAGALLLFSFGAGAAVLVLALL